MQGKRSAITAAIIGNALEWFDFTVYSLFALHIAKAFFPAGSELASLLLALATFGVGFVLRPIGAVILGQYADRAGRRAAMTLVIVLMSVGTAILAFTPGFASIGLAAPILIVIARLIQGFSAGGEMGGATAYLIESAPPERRGFYASWQFAGQAAAALAGSLIAFAVTRALTPIQLEDWGWRVPFILGLSIAPVGFYLRRKMADSEEFLATRATHGFPLLELLGRYRLQLVRSFGVTVLGTACTYLVILNMPTYAVRQLGMDPGDSFIAATMASIVLLVFNPIAGRLSDIIGRQRQILLSAAAIGISAYPLLLLLISHPVLPMLILVQGVLAILLALYIGPSAALIGEMFPAQIRSTGLSLGYNIAVPLFGGFAPFWVTRLDTGDHLAAAYYIICCAVLTIAILMWTGRPYSAASGSA
jgi:MHS family proline/betaine transporter-like MFS transporter